MDYGKSGKEKGNCGLWVGGVHTSLVREISSETKKATLSTAFTKAYENNWTSNIIYNTDILISSLQ